MLRLSCYGVGLNDVGLTRAGVGAFLNVHEGPHGIHCRIRPNEEGIKVYMCCLALSCLVLSCLVSCIVSFCLVLCVLSCLLGVCSVFCVVFFACLMSCPVPSFLFCGVFCWPFRALLLVFWPCFLLVFLLFLVFRCLALLCIR